MLGFQREIEHNYTERIESMLARVLGPGHALARVTAVLELAQSEKTEESFDPDRVAVRNEKRSRETNVTGAATGVAGVSATLTNDPQPAAADDRPKSEREDSTLSYEVSKTTSRRVEAVGEIRKLSVAVMIDGTYQAEGAARVFVARPSEEIDRYREIIKRAVGFNEERGDEIEVVSAPFQAPAAADAAVDAPSLLERVATWSDTLWRAAGLLVTLIVALAVVRPFLLALASRATVAQQARIAGAPAHVGAADATREPAGLIDVVRRNPEQTAQVIKVWLAGEDS
jgi:flagellar M-ring protein FliF